jgi:hypothetical protein
MESCTRKIGLLRRTTLARHARRPNRARRCAAILSALVTACAGNILEGPQGPQAVGSRDPGGAAQGAFQVEDFSGAKVCKGCHPVHYEEWRTSNHGQAMNDPVFLALIARQREDESGGSDRFCTGCHSVIGTKSGAITEGFSANELAPIVREGVTCEVCHRTVALDAGPVLLPHGALQGPYADPASPHPSEQSSLLVEARFCGSCHDVVSEQGVPLETPYREWLQSSAAASAKACQSCHMPAYAGVASSLQGAPQRPNVHRHRFTGVDVTASAADEPGAGLEQLHEESANLLRSGAEIAARAYWLAAPARLRVEVEVKNLIDGHEFPTGSSFFRQAWLSVQAKDARGAALGASGQLDATGDLHDRHHPHGEELDPQLVRLGSYLLDADGDPTLYPWRAREITRHTLAPLERRTFVYEWAVRDAPVFPIAIDVALRFRAFPPALLRGLDLPAIADRLEIVDVSSAAVQLRGPSSSSPAGADHEATPL